VLRQLSVLTGCKRTPAPVKLAIESPVNRTAIPVIYELEWLSLWGEVDVVSTGSRRHWQLVVLLYNAGSRYRVLRVDNDHVVAGILPAGILEEPLCKRAAFCIVVVLKRVNRFGR
jgi:hypothetical protein